MCHPEIMHDQDKEMLCLVVSVGHNTLPEDCNAFLSSS